MGTITILAIIAMMILGFALLIAPLYIWEHTKQHRREARAAAKQAHEDAQAILIALSKLTNTIGDALYAEAADGEGCDNQ